MSTPRKRPYASAKRNASAERTSARILQASKRLFARRGIDAVTIAEIAEKSGVAVSTVYGLFKSKVGILRALTTSALFGSRFRESQALLVGVSDAPTLIALTARVSRAIYESERAELGVLRGMSGFSPVLRKIEQEFEDLRYAMQEERVSLLFAQSRARPGLDFESARRILWMYTSRDVYRMLVHESGWTVDQYQEWLTRTLTDALVDDGG
jgi:AcrR family transcriptional regulator